MNPTKSLISWVKRHRIITGIFVLVIVCVYVLIFTTAPELNKKDEQAKATGQQELVSFMQTSEQAHIVSSYDFTNDRVVYMDTAWYEMTVEQKRDFLTHVGTLKKAATGLQNFEAHDSHTNEKVGEITSFSQSVEVYK
jgi:competence protein ComGC